jgi:hypothetical protein
MSKIFVVETPYWLRHRSILRLYLWRVISACFFLCRSSLLDFWCMLNYINNNHKNIKKKIEKKWSTISTIINNNHKNIKKIQKYIYIYIYIFFIHIYIFGKSPHTPSNYYSINNVCFKLPTSCQYLPPNDENSFNTIKSKKLKI